jgi:hypothetical protein
VWDSAAFSSIFLASSFPCSQTESTPAHTQVTQTVRLPVVRPTVAWQGRKANRQPRHSGTAPVAVKRTAGRRGVTPRGQPVGWSAWRGGRAGVRRGARLTSVPADRLSSRSRTARGRDRRRLNIAVRLRVVKPTVARQGSQANRQTRPSGPAQVARKRTAGRWGVSWWGGRVGVRRGARLTSVPADRLSSPSRPARGRDRRRLNITVGQPVE